MLNLFKKKEQSTSANFQIEGMHCTSCSMYIDSELEEQEGVISSSTSYAKATTKVEFDQTKISIERLKNTIEKLGYKATHS